MKTTPYDALLEEKRVTPGEIARRRGAARLADIARNLESLNALARAEASAGESAAGSIDPEMNTRAVSGEARTEEV